MEHRRRKSALKEDQLSLILENVMSDNCRNYDKGSYFKSRFGDRGGESSFQLKYYCSCRATSEH